MQRHAPPGDPASDCARLARLLQEAPRDALSAMARSVGRDLAAMAYVVLDHREAAESAAAGSIASTVRRTGSGATPADGPKLWVALCGETLRLAVEAYAATREVDAQSMVDDDRDLRSLSPQQRAVAASVILGGLSARELSKALGVQERRVHDWRNQAEAALGSSRALAERVRQQSSSLSLTVSEAEVRRMLEAPSAPTPRPTAWRWALAAPVSAALIVLAAALVGTPPLPRAGTGAGGAGPDGAASRPATASPVSAVAAADVVAAGPGLSLADCRIQPASSELAFRGWLMLSDLAGNAQPAAATIPVYALVTRGVAEWVGWQTPEGRPMFPRPVGRLGCAVDPTTSTATVFALSNSWEPPTLVDGCPASPLLRHGGDLQIGGPGAFALLPTEDQSWWADDPSVRILVRISPAPAAGGEISAEALPLGPGRTLRLGIDSPPLIADRPPSSNHYVWLTGARFTHAGCWLVSVSVDGETVGRAVLPVSQRAG